MVYMYIHVTKNRSSFVYWTQSFELNHFSIEAEIKLENHFF